MVWHKRTVNFLFSRTLAAGILGFLLSLFSTELLFVVPEGLELRVAVFLLIPIIILMIHVAGFLGSVRDRWWEWRRIIRPIKVAVLNPYFDDSEKGSKCQTQFTVNSGWKAFFDDLKDQDNFNVHNIYWTDISAKYAVIINPFSEIYLEGDKRNLCTYEKIKDFVANGGIFCCTGGFPFYYFWDSIIEKPVDTTTRTRIIHDNFIEDKRFFADSLVTKDFGAIITNVPEKPTLIKSYQEELDITFFGDLSNVGENRVIWEFRSLSEESRGVIPGLRVNHGKDVKYPLSAIPYGKGYLVIAGMALKQDAVEFKKLCSGLVNFTNEIARRRQTDWQKNYENTKKKINQLRSEDQKKEKQREKTVAIIGKTIFFALLALVLISLTHMFLNFRNSLSATHNALWKIYITSELQFDFYGALIPLLIGLTFLILYFVCFKISSVKFAISFLLSYAFAIFIFIPQTSAEFIAIVGIPLYFSFVVSLIAVAVAFFTFEYEPNSKQRKLGLEITKKRCVGGILIAASFGFLSVLLLDLTYFCIIGKMYVGAIGLNDGILLSGVYALPIFLFITSLIALFLEIRKLIRLMLGQMHA